MKLSNALASGLLLSAVSLPTLAFDHFITRDGHRLLDGNDEFRFAGIHAPELHRIEDDARGACPSDNTPYFKWPTEDEQRNWIQAIVGTGTKAMRTYVLSVYNNGDENCQRDTHILPPATQGGMPLLNEEAMVVYDRMIAIAEEEGLRLILPFIDHWWWWGGKAELAAFYGEGDNAMYNTGTQTYAAYQDIIRQVLTRTNTVTGRQYKDEKAIMAWETGNELKDTNADFLATTAAWIKQHDSNHLVVDGTYTRVNGYALSDANVDIISNHYYTNVGNNHPGQVQADLEAIGGQKAYLLGEFGLLDWTELDDIMQAAVHTNVNGGKAIGAFVWGFRGHRHDGGFYWHQEYTGHYSYHLPGFPEGDGNQEIKIVDLVRKAAAQMDGLSQAPAIAAPREPVLRAIADVRKINWMGAPLGRAYRIERAENLNGPWSVIGDDVSDGANRYNPEVDSLFSDDSATEDGKTYYYRVIAKNESGESAPSNIQSVQVSAPSFSVFEAENAMLGGNMIIASELTGFSGTGYATDMAQNGSVSWAFDVPSAGQYEIEIGYSADQDKQNHVSVNGNSQNISMPGTGSYDNWGKITLLRDLNAGSNTVTVSANWGYTNIDFLKVYGIEGSEPTNSAPIVNAGADAAAQANEYIALNGSVTDDGMPSNQTTTSWSVVTGNSSDVVFTNAASPATSASFLVAGNYTLRLTASDGELTSTDDVTVQVTEPQTNQAPAVNAGADKTANVNDTVTLTGSASDDGLPNAELAFQWSVTNGNSADVTLSNAQSVSATAQFTVAGTYELQLAADDGEYVSSDRLTVTVNDVPPSPTDLSIEAEVLQLVGVQVAADGTASNGNKVVMQGDGSLTWNVNVTQAGSYSLVIYFRSPFGYKAQSLSVNGVNQGQIGFEQNAVWATVSVPVNMNAGVNIIEISKAWGWMEFDLFELK